ncbi:MAG: metal-dependent hydrolase [Promethearchaeota archaeon]
MPDWVAHLMFGMILSAIFKFKGEKRVIFLIGNLLPDFYRVMMILGNYLGLNAFIKFIAFPINVASHSLLGILFTSAFASIFFNMKAIEEKTQEKTLAQNNATRLIKQHTSLINYTTWKRIQEKPFFLLFIGSFFHLFLDTFMWPWSGGIQWLYPINNADFFWSFKLVWPGDITMIIILLPFFITSSLIEFYKFRKTMNFKNEDFIKSQ